MTASSNPRNTTFNKELRNVFQSNGITNSLAAFPRSAPAAHSVQAAPNLQGGLETLVLSELIPEPQDSSATTSTSKPGNLGQNVSDLKTLKLYPNSNFNLSFRSYILSYHSGILWINSSYFFKLLAQNTRKFLKQYFHFLLS